MKIEFLGNFKNILIAFSNSEGHINLAFTDNSTLESITVCYANIKDFKYLTERFNLNTVELLYWFMEKGIDILELLPE